MTTLSDDVDPFISERVIEIRNSFGVLGLRQAAELIAVEISLYEGATEALAKELSEE